MKIMRNIYELLKLSSISYAKWDYEVSTRILKRKKGLLILLIALSPVLVVSFLGATDVLGGKSAYAPAFYSTDIFLVSILIGLIAGLITGCIGAGGGFIITPALMAAGVKGILAVGTDLFHIFAKAIMGTSVHKKLGNVSGKLAIAFLFGSIGGAYAGGSLNRMLYNKDPLLSEAFISLIYTILLGFLGFYALYDFLKSIKSKDGSDDVHGGGSGDISALGKKLQSLNIPPMIKFDEDYGGKQISGWIIAMGGFFVGVLAAIMGVGGGFATFPMFVYGFGVSSMTTVGTDILQIIFTAGFASISQYAIYGFVFYTLAMGMLLGSLLGIQVGALVTKVVKGIYIRGFYATAILAGFINRGTTLPKKIKELGIVNIPMDVANIIQKVGEIVFWLAVVLFGVWVMTMFFSNIKKLRDEGEEEYIDKKNVNKEWRAKEC